jgi:lipid II:glycine glycyltransferase (peptidoglycan interpeptide bridge formation enzyme)
MIIRPATDRHSWDAFLAAQQFSPFLQSWTMGEVYEAIKQKPVRLEAIENEKIVGIAFAHFVPARRGRHLSVPYGPVVSESAAIPLLIDALKEEAIKLGCSFVRLSPFWPIEQKKSIGTSKTVSSPLHLL